jgi:hypothetical protein
MVIPIRNVWASRRVPHQLQGVVLSHQHSLRTSPCQPLSLSCFLLISSSFHIPSQTSRHTFRQPSTAAMGAPHLTFHLLHRVTFCQPEKFSRHCIGGWGCADLSPFFVHFGGGRGSTINIGSQSGRWLLEKALHGLRCSPCERIWTCFMGCLLCPSVQSLPRHSPLSETLSLSVHPSVLLGL